MSDEKKIKDMEQCETEKSCMPSKPSYVELECERDRLYNRNRELDLLVFALEKSLSSLGKEILSLKDECEYFKEETYKLRKRIRDSENE